MKLKGATIPDAIIARVIARRAAEHCYADLDPARTALVVIDLQHAFMTDGVGACGMPGGPRHRAGGQPSGGGGA
jgi:hypothetical protein